MMKSRHLTPLPRRLFPLALLAALLLTAAAAGAATLDASSPPDTHYGPFGLLDHRSRYGLFWFPEPLTVEETDVDNEVRLDWVHQEGKDVITDEAAVELEKAFGVTTFELEIPYESESESTTDPVTGERAHEHTRGAGSIEISVRRPIHQFVSGNGFFDNTVGAAVEIALPTNSPVSKDTEGVVKVFDALRMGEHFSLQAIGGYSVLIGPEDGGSRTFEYGISAGYCLAYQDLALPHIEQFIPLLELTGESPLNGEEAGENELSGTLGVRANLDAIGTLQPRLGIGYIFPIDKGARDEFKWGLVTSLVFEY
jgi:hypothetical protein